MLGLPEMDIENEQDIEPEMRRIKDWALLPGASIEIRQQGIYVCSGYVDAVTADGEILWVSSPSVDRKLFEKAEFYEAWAFEDRDEFH